MSKDRKLLANLAQMYRKAKFSHKNCDESKTCIKFALMIRRMQAWNAYKTSKDIIDAS